MYLHFKSFLHASLWIGLVTVLAACATISYDQQADQQITNLTQEISLQLITWANQAADSKTPVPYAATFYDKAEADIATLQIRMEASQDPANTKLASIFDSLRDQLEKMRALHEKQNKLSAAFLRAELDLLNVQLATLTTFELSLKASQSSSSSGATSSTSTSTATKKSQASGATGVVSAGLKTT
jgi:hypothetical protein